jgi:hypothetical protein
MPVNLLFANYVEVIIWAMLKKVGFCIFVLAPLRDMEKELAFGHPMGRIIWTGRLEVGAIGIIL